jgi:uncharacterized membrane protein
VNKLEFEQLWLGHWSAQCDVMDYEKKHCPEEPKHYFEYHGREVGLCERCYLNYLHGAFERKDSDPYSLRIDYKNKRLINNER